MHRGPHNSRPGGPPNGKSSNLQLIGCYLDIQADLRLVGNRRTADEMKICAGDHYRWIYRTVAQDESRIAAILKRNHLELPPAQHI